MANDWFSTFTRLIKGNKARAEAVNGLFDQVEAGMDKMPTEIQMNRGTRNYAVDTGVADAYTVTLPHVTTAYQNGQEVVFLTPNANTGPATLDVSGINADAIVLNNGGPLTSGIIQANSIVKVRWNSVNSNWQLSGVQGISTAITAFMATLLDDTSAIQALSTLLITSNANGEGASLVGIEDAGGYFAGGNTESALQSIGNNLRSAPVLLSTKPANNSPTIDFTSVDFTATTYKRYRIEIYGLLAATLTNDLRMRISQAGTFITASDYHTNGTAIASSYEIIASIAMPANNLLHGSIDMFISNGADREMGMSSFQVGTGSSGGVRRDEGEHSRNDAIQTDGFQLFFGTGNITSGVFKLFGIPD